MVDKVQAAAGAVDDQDIDDAGDEQPASERKEPIVRQRKGGDPFADAFEAAEAEVEGEPEPAPAKKSPAKAKTKTDAEADEPAEAAKGPAKQKAKKPEKGAKKPDGNEAGEDRGEGDEDGPEDVGDDVPAKVAKKAAGKDAPDAAAKPAVEKKAAATPEPLVAKAYWPKEKRDAFQYMAREVQERLLAEAPEPHAHWSDDQKSAFARLPRDAQEVVLVQAQEIERGYGQKFQALANERKLAEGIRNAVPANLRKTMAERGLDEVGVFATLLKYQQQSMQDPVGYIRQFIATNRIDPRRLFAAPQPGGEGGGDLQPGQPGSAPPQADLRSHPVLAAMLAEISALKDAVTGDRKQRELDDDRRRNDEMSKALAETDEGGNSRYPYIRLLADPMAQIIESDPERYGSMGVKEQIADAYRRALQQYPELTPPTLVAKPAPQAAADEPDEDEDAEAEREAEAEKLKKASTKKSKTPQTAPSMGGDPFARAFSRAERQIGHR